MNINHTSSRRNYDALSRWYDVLEGGWESKPRNAAISDLSGSTCHRMLEIGCGTGNSLKDLRAIAGERAIILGVDLSSGMLHQAQKNFKRSGQSPSVLLSQAEALVLPLPKDSFDLIFMSFTLELFSPIEIPSVLAECSRVLTPGGQLSLVSISRLCGQNTVLVIYEFLHRVLPQVVDCAPIDAAGYVLQAGFSLRSQRTFSLFGIGVEVITATKMEVIT